MRVALVSPYALDVFGGVQAQVIGLAAALRRRGVEVLVVGPLGDGSAPEGVTGVGRPIAVPANGSRAPVAPWPSAARRARAAVADFAPDVVHLHEPLVPGPCLGVLSMRSAPVVGTFHRSDAGFAYPALRPVLARLARRLALRVAVSPAASATARRALGRRLEPTVILENAVDTDRFDAVAPLRHDGPTVVFLGRHEERKGLEVALRALEFLPGDVRMSVIGDGPQTGRLRARYGEERVRWFGALDNDDAAAVLKGADVFVAPSIGGESFGVVLLEAMAAGVPVVASDLPGYRLAGANAARFVSPGSPEGLARAVQELLAHPSERRELVLAGLRQAASHSFGELSRRYLECYAEVSR